MEKKLKNINVEIPAGKKKAKFFNDHKGASGSFLS